MDFKQGTIRILQSKGHKDWLIYMAEDLTELLHTYEKVLYDNITVCQNGFSMQGRQIDA